MQNAALAGVSMEAGQSGILLLYLRRLVYLGSPLAVTLGNSYSSWGPQNIIQNTYNNIEFKIKNKNTNIARENNSLHHKRS